MLKQLFYSLALGGIAPLPKDQAKLKEGQYSLTQLLFSFLRNSFRKFIALLFSLQHCISLMYVQQLFYVKKVLRDQ
jgi:hypothetical protein